MLYFCVIISGRIKYLNSKLILSPFKCHDTCFLWLLENTHYSLFHLCPNSVQHWTCMHNFWHQNNFQTNSTVSFPAHLEWCIVFNIILWCEWHFKCFCITDSMADFVLLRLTSYLEFSLIHINLCFINDNCHTYCIICQLHIDWK